MVDVLVVAVFLLCSGSDRLLIADGWEVDKSKLENTVKYEQIRKEVGSYPIFNIIWDGSKATTTTEKSDGVSDATCYSVAFVYLTTAASKSLQPSTFDSKTATASFNVKRAYKHTCTPAHAGYHGIAKASAEIYVSFDAKARVRTNAVAMAGGSTSASVSTSALASAGGENGNANITAINVGCNTAGTGYPIGFTVGGSIAGTGATIGVTTRSNGENIYRSGLVFRQYLFSTGEMSLTTPSVTMTIAGKTSASATCTVTPGFIYDSHASSSIVTESKVSNIVLEVECPSSGDGGGG
jgi:hypothetical protein